MRFVIVFCLLFNTLYTHAESKSSSDIRVLVIPKSEATLSAGINAKISEIAGEIGESYDKGQPLIKFVCNVYQAELSKAQAEYTEAKKNYDAYHQLKKHRAISDSELLAAEGRLKKALADVELRSHYTNECVITAPYRCRVVKKLANAHETVASGTELLEIVDSTSLRAQMLMPSSWYNKLKKGREFTIHIDETKKEYKAKISQIAAKVDPASQSVEVIAEFLEQDPSLIAGMSGTAKIEA